MALAQGLAAAHGDACMTGKQGWAALAAVTVFAVAAPSASAAARPALSPTIAAAMKRSPPPPLTTPERAQASARLLKTSAPTTLPAPISISPGASYKDGFAMEFGYAADVSGSPSGGLALIQPGSSQYPAGSMFLKFHTQPGKGYIIDCRTLLGADAAIDLYVGESGPKQASMNLPIGGGHLTWPLFPRPIGQDVIYSVSSGDGGTLLFAACELTTVG